MPADHDILIDLARRLVAMRDGRGSAAALRKAQQRLVESGATQALAERSTWAVADVVATVRRRAAAWRAASPTGTEQ